MSARRLCACCQEEPALPDSPMCNCCAAHEPLRVFEGRPIDWCSDDKAEESP